MRITLGRDHSWLGTTAVLAVVLIAGCGSTVPEARVLGGPESAPAEGDLGVQAPRTLNSPGPSALIGREPTVTDGGAGTGAAPGPQAGSSAQAPGTTSGAGATRPTTTGPVGPGISATTVKVGLAYVSDAAAANRALGASNVAGADAEQVFDAIVADINATGGIAGRKMQPVYAPYDVYSAAPYDSVYQRACGRMTEDDKVFAAITSIVSESFRGCLDKAGVVHVSDGISRSDAVVLQRFRHTYEVGSVRTDRVAARQLEALRDGGYFTGWDHTRGAPGPMPVKLGVVSTDAPSIARAVDQVLVPGLRRLGYEPVVIKISAPQSTAQSGDAAAAIQAAALRLRSEQVSHVIPFESNGSLTLLFTRNAEGQGYRPRYGINTGNGLQYLVETGNVPAEQAVGAVGLSVSPMLDLRDTDNTDNGPYTNAARRKCLDVMRKAGIEIADNNAKHGILGACAAAYFLRDQLNQVVTGRLTLNRDSLLHVVETSASGYLHPDVGPTSYRADRHDGGAAAYVMAHVADCSCLRYVGARRQI